MIDVDAAFEYLEAKIPGAMVFDWKLAKFENVDCIDVVYILNGRTKATTIFKKIGGFYLY